MPKLLNKVNLPRYSSAPSTPSEADLYYNTSDDKIYVYTGAAWMEVGSGAGGSGVFYQSSEPSSPSDGDIWIDSDDEVASVTSVTDSTSTTSSTVAASATAVKSAYDLADGAIPKTLTTTTGDIIYASSANTPARLGIGTADQVLSVAAGVPAWTTPAGGGGMTLIATATASAATTISFTSIPSTYKHLFLVWYGVFQSSDTKGFFVRLNNDSASVYQVNGIAVSGTTVLNLTEANDNGFGASNVINAGVIADTENSNTVLTKTSKGSMTIYRYTDTGRRFVTWSQTSFRPNIITALWNNMQGIYNPSSGSAVDRIDFIRSDTQTITGTIYLYGVS